MIELRKFADWSIRIRKILYPYMFSSFDPVCEQENFLFSWMWETKVSINNRWQKKKIKQEILSCRMHLWLKKTKQRRNVVFFFSLTSIRFCTSKGQLGWLSLITCAHARMSTARLLYKEKEPSILSRPSIKAGIEMICLHRSTQIAQQV
jgi:hypothetical protein